METYIVILASTENLNSFDTYLRGYGTWAKLSKTAWIIKSDKTASRIRDELMKFKKPNDKIFVIRSGALAAWSGASTEVSGWLKKNL